MAADTATAVGAAAAAATAAATADDSVDAVGLALVAAASDGYLEGPGAGDKVAHAHSRATDKLTRQTGALDPSRVVPARMTLLTPAWFLGAASPAGSSSAGDSKSAGAAAHDPLPPAVALPRYSAPDDDAGDVQLVQRAYIDALRERAMHAYGLMRYMRAAEYASYALCHALPARRTGKKIKHMPKRTAEQKQQHAAAAVVSSSVARLAAADGAAGPAAAGGLTPLQLIACSGAVPAVADATAAARLLPAKKFRLSLDAAAQLRDVLARALLKLIAATPSSRAMAAAAVSACPYLRMPLAAQFVCDELLAPHLPRFGDARADGGPRGTTANWKLYAEAAYALALWHSRSSSSSGAVRGGGAAAFSTAAAARAVRVAIAHVYSCDGTDVDGWLQVSRSIELLVSSGTIIAAATAATATTTPAPPTAAAAATTSPASATSTAGAAAGGVLSWLCVDRARSFIALSSRAYHRSGGGGGGGHLSLDPLQSRIAAINAHLTRLALTGHDPRARVGPIALSGRRPTKPSPAAGSGGGAAAQDDDDDDDADEAADKHIKTAAPPAPAPAAAAAVAPALAASRILAVGDSIPARGGGTRTLHACIPTPALVTQFGLHTDSALDGLVRTGGHDDAKAASESGAGGGTWHVSVGEFVERWFRDPFEVYGLCEPNKQLGDGKAPRTRMSQRHADAKGAAATTVADGKTAAAHPSSAKSMRVMKRTEDERDDDDAAREYDDNEFDARLL